LQDKMNLADNVVENSSSDEEGADNTVTPQKQMDHLAVHEDGKNPQSLDESIRSSLSAASKRNLMSPYGTNESFGRPSSQEAPLNENNLPEDQEIVEEEEEEED